MILFNLHVNDQHASIINETYGRIFDYQLFNILKSASPQ
jgi:hypothetical protein